jgi:hypothetical protein
MRNSCTIPDCGRLVEGHGYCVSHYLRWKRHGDPLGGRVSAGEQWEYLIAHVYDDNDDCWAWPWKGVDPYPKATKGGSGKQVKVGIIALELTGRPKPFDRAVMRHLCGPRTEWCWNPRHLDWGTQKENLDDQYLHGTKARRWSLPPEQREAVRARYAAGGVRQQDLADEYGVSQASIYRILRERT